MDERQTFLKAIEDDPLDHCLRCVFADWLDEHGEVEEATRQRQWVDAYEFLRRTFVERDMEDYYDEAIADDENGVADEDYEDDYYKPGSVSQVLAHIDYYYARLVEDGGICFGSDGALESVWDDKTREQFFRTLEIVTGKPLSAEKRAQASFRCAC